jgi:hypothetical protein
VRVLGLILWASFFVAGLTARSAEAQTNRRVVVIHPPATDDIRTEAVTRVQGELTAAGFDVVPVLEREGTDVLSVVEAAVKDMQPLAVFAIFAPPPSASGEATAQILFSDATKGRTLIERMPLDRQHPDHEAKVLAVRAVELLKANLAELWVQPDRGPTPLVVPPPPKVESLQTPTPRAPLAGFGVEAGLGVIEQFHELGASVMPVLKLSLASQLGIGGRLAVGGLGSASTAGATFGLARVQQQFGAADLFFAFPHQRTFQWVVSGGAGAFHVRVEGDGFYPYQGRTTQTWSALAKAGWGASVTLAPKVSFLAELEGLVAFSPTRVLIGDAEVGRMGSPALLFSAGIVGVF